jgi:phospholipid-binding lipoprotein MlaA
MDPKGSLVAVLVVATLLVGCAGRSNFDGRDFPREGTASTPFGPRIQLAQAQSDISQEDDAFLDLFPGDDEMEIEEDFDPFETLNRFIFAINETLDVFILRPAAEVYRFLLPQVVQDSVRNFTRNLDAPVIFLNQLFQGKDEEASETIARFFINSTIGLAGLIDAADHWDLEYREEDFGQTLGFYGAGPGPYLVLPLFGPSSLRDGIGLGVDTLMDPWPYVLDAAEVARDREILLGRRIAAGIDKRGRNIETVDDLRRDSVDFYARIRSLYLQHRRSLIEGGDSQSLYGTTGDQPASETNQ